MAPGRDRADELYERAWDLLHAAQGLRRAAAEPREAPAVAGALGCIQAALDELGRTAAGLGMVSSTHASGPAAADLRAIFERLGLQLTLAESTCGAARERTAALLAPAHHAAS